MKKLIAIFGLTLLASSASAHHSALGGNPDLYQSPLLDHDKGETVHAVQRGIGDDYASQFIRQPADHSDKAQSFRSSEKYDPDGNRDTFAH